jgi:uncharacterized membrane protein
MNYTKWLLEQNPQLESESSVKIFYYVAAAKKQTKTPRILANLIGLLITAIFGYVIGYSAKQLTNMEFYYAIGIAAILSFLLFGYLLVRVEQYLIKKQLSQIVLEDV